LTSPDVVAVVARDDQLAFAARVKRVSRESGQRASRQRFAYRLMNRMALIIVADAVLEPALDQL